MPKEKTKRDKPSIPKLSKRNFDKFIINDERLVYIPTGEIVDNCYTIYDYHDLCELLEAPKETTQHNYYHKWLMGKKFTKLYQVEIRNYSSELSLNAKGLLFTFMMYLKHASNEVIINGKRPTNKELISITNISETTLRRVFDELEAVNLVKRLGNTSSRVILLNPYLCLNGSKILKTTVKTFYKDYK